MDAKNRQFSVYVKENKYTPEYKSVLRTDNIRGKMFVCTSEFISVLRADKIGLTCYLSLRVLLEQTHTTNSH